MANMFIPEAAAKSGVNQATIHSRIKEGKIPYKVDKKTGRKTVVLKDVLAIKHTIKRKSKQKPQPRQQELPLPSNHERLRTVAACAIEIGVDKSTIYGWIEEGWVQKYSMPNDGKYYVDIDECTRVRDAGGMGKRKVIVFEQPRQYSRPKAERSTADRVNDLELLYYDLLEKVDGLVKMQGIQRMAINELEKRINEQRTESAPAIDWSTVERGTRVVDEQDSVGGMFLGLVTDDEQLAWVMYDDAPRPQQRLIEHLKLEENNDE